MAKNKGKKRGLLLGEIRIQRRISKDGKAATRVSQFDNNGELLDYFEMVGMMGVGGRMLTEMYEFTDV